MTIMSNNHMKIKSISLLLIFALIASLTACDQEDKKTPSTASAQEILIVMYDAIKDVKQFELGLTYELIMPNVNERSVELDFKAKLEPISLYLKAMSNGQVDGETIDQEIEKYILQDGDQYVHYMHSYNKDLWQKMTLPASNIQLDFSSLIEEMDSVNTYIENNEDELGADYSKLTVMEDGKNYVISGTFDNLVSGNVLYDIGNLVTMGGLYHISFDMFHTLNAKFELCVNMDTKLPSKLIVDASADDEEAERDETIFWKNAFNFEKGKFELNFKVENFSEIIVPEDVQSKAIEIDPKDFAP